jgi:hypothetical protein
LRISKEKWTYTLRQPKKINLRNRENRKGLISFNNGKTISIRKKNFKLKQIKMKRNLRLHLSRNKAHMTRTHGRRYLEMLKLVKKHMLALKMFPE